MSIDIGKLFERIKQVDLDGLVGATREEAGSDKQHIIVVKFLRLKGALKNKKDDVFTLIIGADNPGERPGDLRFFVRDVDKCDPKSVDMAVYMDANWNTAFGAHKWDPDSGEVRFSYCMNIPPEVPGFPDVPFLQRMFEDMYSGLLFPDAKRMRWNIDADEMLSDSEKAAKTERLDGIVKRLASPRSKDGGAV